MKLKDEREVVLLKNNEVLFEEGDPGGILYLIVAGCIRVYKQDGGKEKKLADLNEGEVLGTLSLLEGSRRTANAKSVGVSKVRPLSTQKLTSMLNDEIPVWYQAILKDVIGRFKTLEQKYLKTQKELDTLKKRS